jgi:hypothetical protein
MIKAERRNMFTCVLKCNGYDHRTGGALAGWFVTSAKRIRNKVDSLNRNRATIVLAMPQQDGFK